MILIKISIMYLKWKYCKKENPGSLSPRIYYYISYFTNSTGLERLPKSLQGFPFESVATL